MKTDFEFPAMIFAFLAGLALLIWSLHNDPSVEIARLESEARIVEAEAKMSPEQLQAKYGPDGKVSGFRFHAKLGTTETAKTP